MTHHQQALVLIVAGAAVFAAVFVAAIIVAAGMFRPKGGNVDNLMDQLAADVARLNTVRASAVALIQGFADRLRNAGNDTAALARLHADLTAQVDQLSAAVVANTPASSEPAPDPVPAPVSTPAPTPPPVPDPSPAAPATGDGSSSPDGTPSA